MAGYAGFNEVFPFMNWLVVEADSTPYKSTGTHVVYDAGGQADGSGGGTSTIAAGLANTIETVPLPTNLRVPGARYCASHEILVPNRARCARIRAKNREGYQARARGE
jgi:hypothetical protein